MHLLVKSYGFKKALIEEAPVALAAFVIAELFYKFHSFALECVAFLVTWYVFSWGLITLRFLLVKRENKNI